MQPLSVDHISKETTAFLFPTGGQPGAQAGAQAVYLNLVL